MFKTIFQWFVYSSKDPQKIALTLKGLVPFLVLLGVADQHVLDAASDSLGEVLVAGAEVVTGAIAVWGLVRKFYITFVKKEY